MDFLPNPDNGYYGWPPAKNADLRDHWKRVARLLRTRLPTAQPFPCARPCHLNDGEVDLALTLKTDRCAPPPSP